MITVAISLLVMNLLMVTLLVTIVTITDSAAVELATLLFGLANLEVVTIYFDATILINLNSYPISMSISRRRK